MPPVTNDCRWIRDTWQDILQWSLCAIQWSRDVPESLTVLTNGTIPNLIRRTQCLTEWQLPALWDVPLSQPSLLVIRQGHWSGGCFCLHLAERRLKWPSDSDLDCCWTSHKRPRDAKFTSKQAMLTEGEGEMVFFFFYILRNDRKDNPDQLNEEHQSHQA